MLNGLVESKLKSQLNFLTDLKAEMKNYGQDAYPRKVRNWFQLPEDSGNKKNCIAAIIQMLELGSVSEDEIEAFYTGIMFWYSLMPVPKIRQGKERRLASVNEALRNLSLPYKIYKREKKWWIVELPHNS